MNMPWQTLLELEYMYNTDTFLDPNMSEGVCKLVLETIEELARFERRVFETEGRAADVRERFEWQLVHGKYLDENQDRAFRTSQTIPCPNCSATGRVPSKLQGNLLPNGRMEEGYPGRDLTCPRCMGRKVIPAGAEP